MTIIFRAGKGQMLNKADFTEDFLDVCNDNGIEILENLGITSRTSDGLVGKIPLPEFIAKCQVWLDGDWDEDTPIVDLVYLVRRITTLQIESEHAIKDSFTHLCWG